MLFTLSYIFLGLYALIVQSVCAREIFVAAYGNELSLGIVFACWLGGVAIGAGFMGRFVHRTRTPLFSYVGLLMLFCLLAPMQITSIRMIRRILRIPPGEFLPLAKLILGTIMTILPCGLLIGALFPLACRIWQAHHSNSYSAPIDRVYIAEAIGSILGGVLFTFFLLPRYDAFGMTVLLAGFGMLLTGLLLMLSKTDKPKITRAFSLLILLCGIGYGIAWVVSLTDILDTFTQQHRWISIQPDLKLIETTNSRYGHLALGNQAEQYALFTNGQYVSVFPDDYGAALTAHFYVSEHLNPQQVLLIGGGAEGVIQEILKHPIDHLDYVELDDKLLPFLADYLTPQAKKALHDPRVSIIYTDGRAYVKRTNHQYDLVITNLPDPTTAMLNRFYTREFFQEVQRILKSDGVFITDLNSSLHLQEDAANYTGSVYKTLRTIFPYVIITPGPTHTFFASSSPDNITDDPDILARRYRTRQIYSSYFSEYHFTTLLWPPEMEAIQSTLHNKLATFPINTDIQPITYFYNFLLWMQFSETLPEREADSFGRNVVRAFSALSLQGILMLIGGMLLLRLLYLRVRSVSLEHVTRFNCVWTIGTTGFAGMALEMILIFAYQNMHGYLYQKVGLIVAIFMLGLAIGGFASHHLVHSSTKGQWFLLFGEISFVLLAALLPLVLRGLGTLSFQSTSEVILLAIVGIAGLLTGWEFPLASAIYFKIRQKLGQTAGILDSADHLGALCGALLVGTLLVPILGLAATCYVVSALKLSSAGLWIAKTRNILTKP